MRAPGICAIVGCPEPATYRGRCDEHKPQPWQGSTRSARLPADWAKRRAKVLRRDGWRCQIEGPRCTRVATEVDHYGDGPEDHRLESLRSVCATCHRERTQRQASEGRKRNRPGDSG